LHAAAPNHDHAKMCTNQLRLREVLRDTAGLGIGGNIKVLGNYSKQAITNTAPD